MLYLNKPNKQQIEYCMIFFAGQEARARLKKKEGILCREFRQPIDITKPACTQNKALTDKHPNLSKDKTYIRHLCTEGTM